MSVVPLDNTDRPYPKLVAFPPIDSCAENPTRHLTGRNSEVSRFPTASEPQCDVAAIKARLENYREKERDIDNQIERLERLTIKATGINGKPITDMPRAPSPASDRMADFVSMKMELETSIRKAVIEQGRERQEIEAIVKQLRRPDERAVIRMRYIDRESWNNVTAMIFGSKEDFEGKEDTYLRRTHKLHGSALYHLAVIIANSQSSTKELAIM